MFVAKMLKINIPVAVGFPDNTPCELNDNPGGNCPLACSNIDLSRTGKPHTLETRFIRSKSSTVAGLISSHPM